MHDIAFPLLYSTTRVISSTIIPGPLTSILETGLTPLKTSYLSHIKKLHVNWSVRRETHFQQHPPTLSLPRLVTVRVKNLPYCFIDGCGLLGNITPHTFIYEHDIMDHLGSCAAFDVKLIPPSVRKIIYLSPVPAHTLPPTALDVPNTIPHIEQTVFIFIPRDQTGYYGIDVTLKEGYRYPPDRNRTMLVHMFAYHIYKTDAPVLIVGLESFPRECRPNDVTWITDEDEVALAFEREIKARLEMVYSRDGYHPAELLAQWAEHPGTRHLNMLKKIKGITVMSLKRYVREESRQDEISQEEAEEWTRVSLHRAGKREIRG